MKDVKQRAEEYLHALRTEKGDLADYMSYVCFDSGVKSAFLAGEAAGFQRGIEAAIAVCRYNFENCQPGTLVSYHIVAEVIRTSLLPSSLSQPGAEEKQGEV